RSVASARRLRWRWKWFCGVQCRKARLAGSTRRRSRGRPCRSGRGLLPLREVLGDLGGDPGAALAAMMRTDQAGLDRPAVGDRAHARDVEQHFTARLVLTRVELAAIGAVEDLRRRNAIQVGVVVVGELVVAAERAGAELLAGSLTQIVKLRRPRPGKHLFAN